MILAPLVTFAILALSRMPVIVGTFLAVVGLVGGGIYLLFS